MLNPETKIKFISGDQDPDKLDCALAKTHWRKGDEPPRNDIMSVREQTKVASDFWKEHTGYFA